MGSASNIRAGEAYLEVAADRGRLKADLSGIAQDLKAFAQGVNVGAIGGGGIAGELAAAGLGMRQLTGLLRVGTDALRGSMAAVRGDWEAVDQALRSMPMGVGQVYGAVRDLRAELDGSAEAARRLEQAWADFQGAAAGRGRFVQGLSDLRDTISKMEAEARSAGATGLDKTLIDIAQRASDRRADILKGAKERGVGPEHPEVARALVAATAVEDAQRMAALRAEGERAYAATAAEQARLKALETMERQKRAAEELADIERAAHREAAEWVREAEAMADAEDRRAQDRADRAQGIEESVRTPEEAARARIEEIEALKDLLSPEAYDRAIRQAVEDAAAAMPDVAQRTLGARGTFSAFEAASALGAGNVQDRIAQATSDTARNTQRIAELAARLGVTFN